MDTGAPTSPLDTLGGIDTSRASPTASSTGDSSRHDTATRGTTTDTDPRCAARTLPREVQLVHGGLVRSALLAGPAVLPDEPMPLVLHFHGYTDSPTQQEGYSGMSEHAAAEGYVVAYPQGTGPVGSFNGGRCCGSAMLADIDDVGFTQALIEGIADHLCIDRTQVYAVGFSNGGFLAHRLACELSDQLAGVGSVAGVMGVDTCAPSRPLPVVQVHGTSDRIMPIGGNALLGYPSVDETMAGWAQRLGCDPTVPVEVYAQGDATCVQWVGCAEPLVQCTIDGGGHTWPGGTAPAVRGRVSQDLDANAFLWDVLSAAP